MITLPLLNSADFLIIDPLIKKINYKDGKNGAHGAAKLVKKNEEADVTDKNYQTAVNYIYSKLFKDQYVLSYAHTRLITQPIINRTSVGGGYGTHFDNVFMDFRDRKIRTDLSFTIFLQDPNEYDGGELEIDFPNNKTRIKLDKGSICIYPSSRWHQVLPVTRGERICCVGWIESNIKSESAREALWDLVLFSKHLTDLNAPQSTILEYSKLTNYLIKTIAQI
jgi:PKHD-type hydroxylase